MSVTTLRDGETWEALRSQVNLQLAAYLEQGTACPGRLHDAMAYSLLAGGKRLRPLLVLLACDACGGDTDRAMSAACAIEMVHTYSLIHDDLPAMDDDSLRRGRPTNHLVFGEALAILAGDALLTLAFQILATEVQPPDVAADCCAELAMGAGAAGMVGGQAADLEASVSGVPSVEALESIHRRKTGRLLCSALRMGARIAGADASTFEALTEYGHRVGLAFQIADDLLDVAGEETTMGKGVRKDADHGKVTYPSLLGETKSRDLAQTLIDEACCAIAPLGDRGRRLEELAHFVLERNH